MYYRSGLVVLVVLALSLSAAGISCGRAATGQAERRAEPIARFEDTAVAQHLAHGDLTADLHEGDAHSACGDSRDLEALGAVVNGRTGASSCHPRGRGRLRFTRG